MKRKPDATDREQIPLLLRTPAFMSAWAMFVQHRKEKKSPLTPTAAKLQLRKMEEWGEGRAIAAIKHSVENGYTGIFEPRDQPITAVRAAQPRW